MKINVNINVNNDEANKSLILKKQPKSCYKYTSISILAHLSIIGLLFSSVLFAENTHQNEGDNSIKAVMIDLSQMAAPKQLLVESTPDIKGDDKSEIIDNKVIEETPVESTPEPEKEIVEDKKDEVLPELSTMQASQKTEKQFDKHHEKFKHKRKNKPMQRSSRQQIRQEVAVDNIAETSVAPAISDNQQYSATPSAISRKQPEYPRRALDMHIEGHVVVLYDINNEGKVENIRFIEALPNNIFNQSVKQAMKSWKYKQVAARNLKIKIVFNRNKSVNMSNV